MRRFNIMLVAIFCLMATNVIADGYWHGPGWYVVDWTSNPKSALWSGPYSSEDRCEQILQKTVEDEPGLGLGLSCAWLDKNPTD